jgi:hypothetical protein
MKISSKIETKRDTNLLSATSNISSILSLFRKNKRRLSPLTPESRNGGAKIDVRYSAKGR